MPKSTSKLSTRARSSSGASHRESACARDKNWLAWLDLSRYSRTASFTLFEWGQQFSARRILLNSVEVPFAAHLHKQVAEQPLNLGSHTPLLILRQAIQDMSHDDVRFQQSLYSLPGLRDAVQQWDSENQNLSAGQRVVRAVLQPGLRLPDLCVHNFILEAALGLSQSEEASQSVQDLRHSLAVAFIGVDLERSDAVLRNEFSSWLARKRSALKKIGIKSLSPPVKAKSANRRVPALLLTQTAMRRWADHHVLPYLDIQIKAKFEGRKPPIAAAIGEYFFQDRDRPENIIHQEVAPLARLLVEKDSIFRMVADGQEEFRRKHSD